MKAFIAVTAAQGAFLRVRHVIQNLPFGPKTKILNCHDAIGICDVILEVVFDGIRKDFFNEVISVINNNDEVNMVKTFIAYDSCDKGNSTKPLTGYLFIGVIPSQISHVKKELCNFSEINSTSIVAGEFDIVATTTCPLEEMPEFYERLVIPGIKKTSTCLPLDTLRALKNKTKIKLFQSDKLIQGERQQEQLNPQTQNIV